MDVIMNGQKYNLPPLVGALLGLKPHVQEAIEAYGEACAAAAIAAAPDGQIKAKPLEWQCSDTGRNWNESRMGFWISFDPDEVPGHLYTAGWGEDELEGFDTLEVAKKYCQDSADTFVRERVSVELTATAHELVCKWVFLVGHGYRPGCIDASEGIDPIRSLNPDDSFCPHCGREIQVVGNE